MEERESHNKNRLVLTIIAIAILLVATIGATFAYFSATSKTVNQNVTTGELKVTATSSVINNEDIKPTTWDTDMSNNYSNTDIVKITLDVDTTGTSITTGKYDIELTTDGIKLKDQIDSAIPESDPITLEGGKLDDVKWALYQTSGADDTVGTTKVGDGSFCIKMANQNVCDESKIAEKNGDVKDLKLNSNPVEIDSNGFNEEGKSTQIDKYILYIWIENTEDTEGKVGSGKQDMLQAMEISATLKVSAIQ